MNERPRPGSSPLPVLSYGPPPDPESRAFWPNGPFLVMRVSAEIPMRCIKCNRPTETLVRKRLFWADTHTSTGGALRFLPFMRIFFAFASMVRWFADLRTFQSPVVNVPLCERHRLITRALTLIAYFAFPAGVGLLAVPTGEQLHLLGPVLGFFMSVILWSRPRPVKAVHAGQGYVTLAGVGVAYLLSIAQAPHSPAPAVSDIIASTQALRERLEARKRDESKESEAWGRSAK